MQRRTLAFPIFLLSVSYAVLLLQGCGGGDKITDIEGSSTVSITVTGLEPITGGLNYQAWAVSQSGSNVYGFPLVIFNVNETGQMVDPVADTVLVGPYHADLDPNEVIGVAVSLEISDHLLEHSSYTFILSGEMVQGTATLSAEDFFALNRDFSNAAGRYILATPTDATPDNDFTGIWFVDPTSVPAEAGLVLPEAPNGWIYEGWVDLDGKAISTGKFLLPNEADSSSFYSDLGEVPLFPGEDFLFNPPQGFEFPLDLRGASVFITIEPWNQWDLYPEDPFFLRILEGQIPVDAAPSTPYSMNSLANQLPTGTATVHEGS
jgi:hypothetical protein